MMNPRLLLDPFEDDMLAADDPDFLASEWTLDDLDRSADLGSVRSAWTGSDDPTE